ncbi:MAG: PLP-dependent transferase [Proteobacteria bacterium]|nr:PLP-dependent transferase [Pseudomonadota bacterium]
MVPFFDSVRSLLNKCPKNWVELTTHRLDVYNEPKAKSEFLFELKKLISNGDYSSKDLDQLPTAYDYIRLGHQLSSLLEWVIAEVNNVTDEQVITFASQTMPILSLLRRNTLKGASTYIYYDGGCSPLVDEPRLKEIYGYQFTLQKIDGVADIPQHSDGTVVFVTQSAFNKLLDTTQNIDVTVNLHLHPLFGCAMLVHNSAINDLIDDVQHVRRRETIAMTPVNCLNLLKVIVNGESSAPIDSEKHNKQHKQTIVDCIKENTGSQLMPLIASSGLSIQYAMMMGLVENALTHYPNKAIKILLPPNCYGGTNDQSRRIADLLANVSIVDMLVDGGQDLVTSLDAALDVVAKADGVALVLAEIPTNPRVEVPDMNKLGEVLSRKRFTQHNDLAVEPFFMVDQTFCPNVKLLHQESELMGVKTISFTSGSKFPSGGRCIAGYCAGNNAAKDLLGLISDHLVLSDNLANPDQLRTLAKNMPSMPDRIKQAYKKTRELVNYIQALLPQSKIYYVSDDMAQQGFMPSVFSLDLPATGETSGQTSKERSENQRQLNIKLIEFMINAHPNDCKNCVSYGQLKGSYWTIPATSTQGTTKEEDKDYIVRVALSPDVDVALLSQSFARFCLENRLKTT